MICVECSRDGWRDRSFAERSFRLPLQRPGGSARCKAVRSGLRVLIPDSSGTGLRSFLGGGGLRAYTQAQPINLHQVF